MQSSRDHDWPFNSTIDISVCSKAIPHFVSIFKETTDLQELHESSPNFAFR
jgi:hypothetical protein